MMKFAILIASVLILSVSANSELSLRWEEYKQKHGKKYESAEMEEFRYQLWSVAVDRIDTHNKRYEAGEVTYKLGLNKMSDMTAEEKRRMRGGKGVVSQWAATRNNRLHKVTGDPLPKSVDWRTKGAVNAVKDQGQCGSCWTFSAVASLEGQYFLKNKKLLSFSEQQLVDCVTDCHGCKGGLMDSAFTYLEGAGLQLEKDYPYKAVTQDCHYDPTKAAFEHLVSHVDVTPEDENALQDAIAKVGPISIAIDAGHNDFQEYSEGVFTSDECGNQMDDLDHGVAVVGYGTTDDGQEYYIVRNSWGEDWGEKGYIKMARNKNNMCGIATLPSYPQF